MHLGGLVGDAKHGGCIGTVDIGIQQSHPQALLSQRTGKVDGHGALADPAFAAAYGNHLTHPWDRLAFRRLAMSGLADTSLAWRLADLDLHIVYAVELQEQPAGFLHDSVPLALGEARQIEAKHCTGIGDTDLINPAQLHRGFAAAGIRHLLQRLDRLLGRNHAHRFSEPDPRGGIP